MEIIYGVDVKMSNDGEEFERALAMDISSMNILACSCYYLFASSKLKYSPHLVSTYKFFISFFVDNRFRFKDLYNKLLNHHSVFTFVHLNNHGILV
jgi:hypothetical protein